MSDSSPDKLELQDYLDGRLPADRRQQIEEFLNSNPIEYAEFIKMRETDAMLRVIAQPALEEPVPEKLLAVLGMARSLAQGSSVAAGTDREAPVEAPSAGRWRPTGGFSNMRGGFPAVVSVVALVLGIALGLGAAKVIGPSNQEKADILTSAMLAYSFYAQEKEYAVEFGSARTSEWNAYMKRSFSAEIPPPDLSARGYSYIGARMVPGRSSRMAFYLFENKDGNRVSVFFAQSGEKESSRSLRSTVPEDLFAKEWSEQGWDFALLAPMMKAGVDGDVTMFDAVKTFYNDYFVNIVAPSN